MEHSETRLPDVGALLAQRLIVVGDLARSLEESRLSLRQNDAEAIARGAAHQAELCRQWSLLEDQLRAQAARRPVQRGGHRSQRVVNMPGAPDSARERSIQLEAEWAALSARIRYLARVHASLLRHMQRSLEVWSRVISSCAPMYAPPATAIASPMVPRAGE